MSTLEGNKAEIGTRRPVIEALLTVRDRVTCQVPGALEAADAVRWMRTGPENLSANFTPGGRRG